MARTIQTSIMAAANELLEFEECRDGKFRCAIPTALRARGVTSVEIEAVRSVNKSAARDLFRVRVKVVADRGDGVLETEEITRHVVATLSAKEPSAAMAVARADAEGIASEISSAMACAAFYARTTNGQKTDDPFKRLRRGVVPVEDMGDIPFNVNFLNYADV